MKQFLVLIIHYTNLVVFSTCFGVIKEFFELFPPNFLEDFSFTLNFFLSSSLGFLMVEVALTNL